MFGLQLRCNATQRREIRDVVDIFKGNVSLLPFMSMGSMLVLLDYLLTWHSARLRPTNRIHNMVHDVALPPQLQGNANA